MLHLPDLVRGEIESGPDSGHARRGDALEEHARLLSQSLQGALKREPHRPLVCVVCPWQQACGHPDALEPLAQSCERAAEHLVSALSESHAHVVLPAELERMVNGANMFDEVANRLGHIPFTNELQCAVATAAARRINAEIGDPVIKVLAVDCDNTLWGNAVSEVGPEGLEITVCTGENLYSRLLVHTHLPRHLSPEPLFLLPV